eukprot:GHRR01021476.1.p1 GENE.GHRR01021476.1~~GHRR01021476.1.p1  ORF type:complete len:164 (-),score=49.82 GHRR01021476.1:917-1381(-)
MAGTGCCTGCCCCCCCCCAAGWAAATPGTAVAAAAAAPAPTAVAMISNVLAVLRARRSSRLQDFSWPRSTWQRLLRDWAFSTIAVLQMTQSKCKQQTGRSCVGLYSVAGLFRVDYMQLEANEAGLPCGYVLRDCVAYASAVDMHSKQSMMHSGR